MQACRVFALLSGQVSEMETIFSIPRSHRHSVRHALGVGPVEQRVLLVASFVTPFVLSHEMLLLAPSHPSHVDRRTNKIRYIHVNGHLPSIVKGS